METITKQHLLDYRRKHFAVEVKPSHSPEHDGELTMSVTHNGRQWHSTGLMPDEAIRIIHALEAAIIRKDETASK